MQVQIFKYESPEEHILNQIRTIELDGEVWFVATDVAKALGYSNPHDAIGRHCKSKGGVKHEVPTDSSEL